MDNPDMNSEGTSQSGAASSADQSSTAQLNDSTAYLLTRIYFDQRIEYQLEFYRQRSREYESNIDIAFRIGAILMVSSSLLASLGIFVDIIYAPLIALFTAIIPALASFVSAFSQLYTWQSQLSIYRDTQLRLEGTKLMIPDIASLQPAQAKATFPRLVSSVEDILKDEVTQWGQLSREREDEKRNEEAFIRDYGAALTDGEGKLDQDVLDSVSAILNHPGTVSGAEILAADTENDDSNEVPFDRTATAFAASAQSTSRAPTQESPPILPTTDNLVSPDTDATSEDDTSIG